MKHRQDLDSLFGLRQEEVECMMKCNFLGGLSPGELLLLYLPLFLIWD